MQIPTFVPIALTIVILCQSACSDWLGKKEHASSRTVVEISGQSDGQGEGENPTRTDGPTENPFSDLTADQCQGVETNSAAPSGLYRMTKQEYATLVRDLFGISPDLVAGTLPDDMSANGYDNQTLNQSVHYGTVSAYRDSAKVIIAQLKGQANPLGRWFTCDLETTASCVDSGLLAMATEVFHNIPSAVDLQSYKDLFQVGLELEANSNTQAALLVLEGMLQSPNFLYRVEIGTRNGDSPLVALTSYEIANRLASTLWMSKPDAMLLEAAKQSKLSAKEDILKVARLMLEDERAVANMEHFFRQWLHIDRLKFHSNTMSEFSESLRNDMMEEMKLLTNHYAWSADANFLDLYSSPYSFLNTALADLYQADNSGLSATSFARTSYPAEGSRAGILGTAGFLTLSSKPDRVSIIHRGAFVRKFLLCDSLGVPPPEVEAMGASANESEELQHANSPQCAACHRLIDSVGLGLNHYDAMGRTRNVPAQGHIWYATGNKDFSGSLELGQLLKEDPKAGSCVAQQLFRYILRRAPNPLVKSDACFVANVAAAGKASRHSFREYMLAIVASDAFRMKLDQ